MTAEPRKGLFVRLPAELHAELTRRAEGQGASLNQYIGVLLAGAIGFTQGLSDADVMALAVARGLITPG